MPRFIMKCVESDFDGRYTHVAFYPITAYSKGSAVSIVETAKRNKDISIFGIPMLLCIMEDIEIMTIDEWFERHEK